jgi:hypothetical protein
MDGESNNFRLVDITPMSLGKNVKNDVSGKFNKMSIQIPIGTTIPASITKLVTTDYDNQKII